MGAKKTSEIIPLCHVISLTKVAVDFEMIGERKDRNPKKRYIRAVCTVRCEGKTGVEMEALTGVNTALLTIYDMCKAVDKSMEMTDIFLCRKKVVHQETMSGRKIDYLRISLTDRCNLRCRYCMPHDIDSVPMSEILTYEEIREITRVAAQEGIRHVRVTGRGASCTERMSGLCPDAESDSGN